MRFIRYRDEIHADRFLSVSPLDEFHWMAKVGRESRYEKKDGTPLQINFSIIYLLQTIGNTPKIFAYTVGDEQKVLREYGLEK